jgi:hypothetical protein
MRERLNHGFARSADLRDSGGFFVSTLPSTPPSAESAQTTVKKKKKQVDDKKQQQKHVKKKVPVGRAECGLG